MLEEKLKLEQEEKRKKEEMQQAFNKEASQLLHEKLYPNKNKEDNGSIFFRTKFLNQNYNQGTIISLFNLCSKYNFTFKKASNINQKMEKRIKNFVPYDPYLIFVVNIILLSKKHQI